jgi:hypothetical protein
MPFFNIPDLMSQQGDNGFSNASLLLGWFGKAYFDKFAR